MAWVVIANLKGVPGDAAALEQIQQILAELARLAKQDQNNLVALSDWVRGVESRTPAGMNGTDYALAFADAESNLAGGALATGRFNFEMPPRVQKMLGVVAQPVLAPGWAFIYPDSTGRIAWGVRTDGTFVAHKFDGGTGSGGDPAGIANIVAGMSRSLRTKIVTPGDSLTDGYFGGTGGQRSDAWPAKLQALLGSGVEVINAATSGYCVDEEAIKIGALPLPLTVASGQIPASGPVEVTTDAVIGWREAGVTRTFAGSLAGVPGTLTRTESDTVFTFTRTTAGTAVAVPPGTVFVSSFAGYDAHTMVLMIGFNNVAYNVKGGDATVAEHVRNGIRRIVNWHSRTIKQVLVLSVTTAVPWTSGTANYSTVATINGYLAEDWRTKYYDLRRYLVDQAIYDLGLVPNTADTAAMAADTLPPSIMDPGAGGTGDGTHYSKATAALVGQRVFDYVTTRDWVNQ
ncbi:SGNH/GDSL hydrolase family protein [Glutamicibacter protophormiae]|uniref:SGNH/GDSL hydrolase family protein n=1 Tax=Glutamicibacter protophormiae TaxID=37930 RepID=UPI00195DE15E|nr:SGNH/GDSL hydrolase family protein [Glutamicibacter protophormiae]QRQ79092.1 hypothetical protein JQN66_02215 [Glutamicibacter protophormiae]